MTIHIEDDTERDTWRSRIPMSKEDKLEEIRRMRAALRWPDQPPRP